MDARVLLQHISLPTGFAAIIAQFHINHFRSVAWYNVIIGVGYIFLQLAMFRGESRCDCQNTCRKSTCSLPKKSRIKEMMTYSNVFLIMVSLKYSYWSHSQFTILGTRPVNLVVNDINAFTVKKIVLANWLASTVA